jgi:cytoskeletal protein CcmA (bactofilin family)
LKFKREDPDEIVSIFGEGVEVSGEVSFANGLRVDGVLKGKLRSEGLLVVGPRGKIDAEVFIRRASISGEFRGSIHATDRVEIHNEGRVFGDLFTPCLIIEAGALFEGKCNMSDRKGAKEEASGLKVVEANSESPKSSQHAAGSEKPWLK